MSDCANKVSQSVSHIGPLQIVYWRTEPIIVMRVERARVVLQQRSMQHCTLHDVGGL